MIKTPISLAFVFSTGLLVSAQENLIHTFKKIHVSKDFWGEGANFGDFNRDGVQDVVSGPYWFEGPAFAKKHEYSPATQTWKRKKPDGTSETMPGFEGGLGVNNAYSENFFAFTYDFNRDGWDDILIMGFPGKDTSWYENPRGRDGHWQRHMALEVTDNESPAFTDINGDGKPDIVCNSGGYFGYATADWSDPARPWKFHPITPKGPWQRFTHGMGIGDINGDGRMDLLEKDGWWEQPVSLAGDPGWKKHAVNFGGGGAQMYAYDVNGDGANDVITSLAAHGYGLVWYESRKENGEFAFVPHTILNKEPNENKYGLVITQMHAIDLIDMDGDGIKDIVTGKRFWAHGPAGDAEPGAPAVLYWFKLVRSPGKSVDFIPYLVDNDSGVGTQVVAGKINGDALPDIVVGNKKGTFVFLHETKKASQAEWEKAQPKLFQPATK